jgi:cutinase
VESNENRSSVITSIQSSCPDTEMVLGGYSQGGYVVHNAANDVGDDAMSKVKAVVIFGDPDSHEPVNGIDPSRVKIICHEGDDICDQGDLILLQHLTYAEDAASAASFVVSQL